ncbi:hypothetical protein SLUN_04675 [Streptomyces lunaelactis]|uniref:Uncharacterized protein n=1 Tax=Streptomyces lunaelactis TaxID=1535768 RepID=A0A2R4SXJ3_9ACTN|nr:hypothetical protein SLUN_04675 [Streptomyces lunaelactis]
MNSGRPLKAVTLIFSWAAPSTWCQGEVFGDADSGGREAGDLFAGGDRGGTGSSVVVRAVSWNRSKRALRTVATSVPSTSPFRKVPRRGAAPAVTVMRPRKGV